MQVGFLKSKAVMEIAAVALGVVDNLVMDMEKKAVFDALCEAIRPVLDDYETRMQRMISRVKPSNN